MKASFLSRLLDVISPRQCAMCGNRLTPSESAICHGCHLRLPVTRLEQSPLDNPMARMFWGRFPVENVAAWFYYEPHSRTSYLIHDIKYHNRPLLARQVGRIMAERMSESHFFDGIDAIVPVPLTRRRQWQRGYNQSEEVCRGISEVTGLPIYNKVLKRVVFKGSQTKMNVFQRRENVEAAFTLADADRIVGLHLLLVDDIITTGATVTVCAQQLCKAAGVRVSILSLGKTLS